MNILVPQSLDKNIERKKTTLEIPIIIAYIPGLPNVIEKVKLKNNAEWNI